MNLVRQHILFKGLALFVVLTLLLPSVVKIMHNFENHKHEVCYGESNAHFHTLDIDCEFYNFNLSNPFTLTESISILIIFPEIRDLITTDYTFLSEYQRHHFLRRGPPAINLI